MNTFLPKLSLLTIIFFFGFFLTTLFAHPAEAAPAPVIPPGCTAGTDGNITCPTGGTWVQDPEVTFTGKNAARARDLLNWTLRDYRWTFTSDNTKNPLMGFWVVIRNIIYSVFVLFVIATSFILIATRGKSLSAMRFIPRFFAIMLLVTLSFSTISLLYQTTDIVQGFFLKSPRPSANNQPCPPACIAQEDLFYIDWTYKDFIGYRLLGDENAESAFMNLLLVKLTAFTYYVMVGTLFVRKIILWFFIILSPVFPLLLLYYPVRNTGKIWIGEFFRWLLYAPLFTIFLRGLVELWRSDTNIPLNFQPVAGNADKIIYPTATSILIGGPRMILNLNNSANNVDTFALYLVALLMLWMVILLPWVLLQIFLEYSMSYNYSESPAFQGLMGWAKRQRSPQTPPPIPPPPPRKATIEIPPIKKPIIPPPPPAGTGLARTIPTESTAVYKKPSLVIKPMPEHIKTLRATNLSVPTMRDVARFETAMVANKTSEIHEISRVKDTLSKLGNPTNITNTTEQSRFNELRQQLIQQSNAGNIMASTIMNATNTMNVVKNSMSQMTTNSSTQVVNQIRETLSKISNPSAITNVVEKQKYNTINKALTEASNQGNQFASTTLSTMTTIANAATPEAQKAEIAKLKESLLEEKQKGNELAKQLVTFVDQQSTPVAVPQQNQVQTVSLEDYEAVRKMWSKNYQSMDVPQNVTKGQVSRKQWIQDDINQITQTINMLSSSDPAVVDQGLQTVSDILPFLMMGGFTLPEITAYLKAKQQAATDSLEVVSSKEEEEESLVETSTSGHAAASMHQSMTIPGASETTTSTPSSGTSAAEDDDEGDSMLSNITQQVVKQPTAVVNIFPSFMNAISLTPHSTPSLKDVVKYESSMVTRTEQVQSDVTKTQDLLTQLADPTIILDQTERQKVETLKAQLTKESQAGNTMATAILQAATTIASVKNVTKQVANQVRSAATFILKPETVTDTTKQQVFKEIHDELRKEKESGNQFAVNVLSLSDVLVKALPNTYNEQMAVAALKVKVDEEQQKGNKLAQKIFPLLVVENASVQPLALPKQNTVQTVSLEDYEAVKKMWQENYQHMDVPQSLTSGQVTRETWIADDIVEIQRIVNLLSSNDPKMQQEGISAVSHILPFLLIGGFSLTEIIAYLKAKLEAAKAALGIVQAVKNEEDQQIDVPSTSPSTETPQAMTMNEPLPSTPEQPTITSSFDQPEETGASPLKNLEDEKELKDLADEPEGPKELEDLDKQPN